MGREPFMVCNQCPECLGDIWTPWLESGLTSCPDPECAGVVDHAFNARHSNSPYDDDDDDDDFYDVEERG